MSSALQSPPRPTARKTNGRVPPLPPERGWGGDDDRDPQPRRGLDNLRVALLFFMGAEMMFFAALVSALFVLRLGMAAWPPPLEPRLPVAVTAVNTVVLLYSSVSMRAAVRALRGGTRATFVRLLATTAALGATFLLVQGYEWVRLIHFGLTLSSGIYGATFYTLIGLHALHVTGALVWLLATTWLARRGAFAAPGRATPVQACAMYWHFVVALWPGLFVAVYLL
ncbi:MAG TPA: heme-copper oxidase subunit III [Methylomirabilota bacterium]|nr:heme-copper oxidase subunit III [Methylomirabilota bacterium]